MPRVGLLLTNSNKPMLKTLQPTCVLIGIIAALTATALQTAAAQTAADVPASPAAINAEQCRALADFASTRATDSTLKDLLAELPEAPTSIMQAEVEAARDNMPEVCRVNGLIAPDIQFELRMPTKTWNGKFMHYGCGGACGVIYRPQLEEPIERGYATVASDMGHTGAPNNFTFTYANLQALIDFSYRATHVVTMAAKEVVKAYYRQPAKYSYFMGCSTGGVQGVIEAQRYPHDFDGIIAGAPAYSNGPSFIEWSMRANQDAAGRGIVDPDKLPMLRQAVLGACDHLDGYKDGLLQDPRACNFDPAQLQCPDGQDGKGCFTPDEVRVVKKLYAGPTNSQGEKLSYGQGGLSYGSEYEWSPFYVGPKGQLVKRSGFLNVSFGNGIYAPAAANAGKLYDFDADPASDNIYFGGRTLQWLRYAGNPDLRRFRDRGGKLILWHGWDDSETAPGASADYYDTATNTMGGPTAIQEFFRLFMLPGMAHCRRGPGGDAVDWITYLENWVEKGQAPDAVITHHLIKEQNYLGLPRPRYPLPAGSFDRTRPVYPYPAIARYKGKGDPKQAASWRKGKVRE